MGHLNLNNSGGHKEFLTLLKPKSYTPRVLILSLLRIYNNTILKYDTY